jgi:hypothetical protein
VHFDARSQFSSGNLGAVFARYRSPKMPCTAAQGTPSLEMQTA